MKKMNKKLCYKLLAEVAFTLGYLTAILTTNNANNFIIRVFIFIFALSLASYVVYRNTENKAYRIIIYTVLAFCGLILILISKYFSIGAGISIAIILIGSILCAPFILLIENMI